MKRFMVYCFAGDCTDLRICLRNNLPVVIAEDIGIHTAGPREYTLFADHDGTAAQLQRLLSDHPQFKVV